MDIFPLLSSNQYVAMAMGVKHIIPQPRMPVMNQDPTTPKSTKPTNNSKSSLSLFKRKSIEDTATSCRNRGSNKARICDVVDRHRLLQTGDFSDCTLVACGKEFKLHKAVICYQSQFFWKALTCEMREGLSGVVELPEETELDDVSRMVKFMYEQEYRDSPSTDARIQTALENLTRSASGEIDHLRPIQAAIDEVWLDIRMYSLGNRYMIEGLKKASLDSFRKDLESDCLFPVAIARVNPEGALRFIANDPDTVPTIIDLCKRIWLEGEDLSQSHKDAIFELCFKLYPCLMKFEAFREALLGDLSSIAAEILVRVTGERTERMVERCCGCEAPLLDEAAMELTSWCHTCKRHRRAEDLRIEIMGRSIRPPCQRRDWLQ